MAEYLNPEIDLVGSIENAFGDTFMFPNERLMIPFDMARNMNKEFELTFNFKHVQNGQIWLYEPEVAHTSEIIPELNASVKESITVHSPYNRDQNTFPLIGIGRVETGNRLEQARFDIKPRNLDTIYSIFVNSEDIAKFGIGSMVKVWNISR